MTDRATEHHHRRGDREREIAAAERERAAEEWRLAEVGPEETWSLHERVANAHEQSARLHDALAALYDQHDDAK